MAWEKPSPQLIERFGTWLPAGEGVERRTMFGCPCAFVNGNMFAGVYQQSIVVRLDESAREQLIATQRGRPFTVSGRTMREYVMLTDALARAEVETIALVRAAFAFASRLPVKEKSGKKRQSAQRSPGGKR